MTEVQISLDESVPSGLYRPLQTVNESPLSTSSTTHAQESLQVKEVTHQSSEQSTENQQMRINEVPIDTVLKETDDSAISRSQSDSNNSLTMSIKSSKSLSIKQTSKKNSLQSSIKMKSEVDHLTIKSMANSSILSLDASSTLINQQHCRLPSRNSFFKDATISSLEQISFLKDRCLSGPLYELFCKFLDEPDPLEPNYRLCAPILYLPSPERYPEFYRFTLSSHLSGSGLNVKFTTNFTNRLFSPIDNLSNYTIINNNDEIYHVEYPSLCLASIASRFILNATKDQTLNNNDNLSPQHHHHHHLLHIELSEIEENHFLIITNDNIMESLYSLDIAMDNMFTVWEAFTGRRSWFGRRLMKLKSVYIKHRTNLVESLKLENHIPVAMPKSFIPCITKSQNNSSKKKTDRRALERGAEVIRCLCGFRVEGGHVMVQCDLCASWQHLPCLWWALSLAIRNDSSNALNSNLVRLCKTALIAAQAVGGGGGNTGEVDVKGEDDREVDAPYICPVCLKLDNLTKEYPRSLSAAMSLNDVDAVFDLQDTLVKGEHEFWTLGSPDGTCQIRTDDYAFVNRFWLNHLNISQDISKGTTTTVLTNVKQLLDQSLQSPVKSAYDRIIVRIYRLWKDVSGLAWLEGGLFLRPYDLPPLSVITDSSKCPQFWHHDEVVYDEARRVILPLDAWIGRCMVLCPSAYRVGRPADLLYTAHIKEFMPSLKNDNLNDSNSTANQFQYFFVCEKLFEQSSVDNHSCRFDEISPGYLKVSMKPYCFLRKPDNQCIRGSLPRQYSAVELLTRDQIPFSEASLKDEQTFEIKTSPEECTTTSGNMSNSDEKNATVPVGSLKQKGEKLARVVDWLERKRQTNSSQSTVTLPQNSIVSEQQQQQTSISLLPVENNPVVDEISLPSSRSLCSRGRIPLRINRGRSRGFNKSLKLTSSNPVSLLPDKFSSSTAVLSDKIDDISSSKEDESLNIPVKRTCMSGNSSPTQSNVVQISSEINVDHNLSSSVIIDSNNSLCNTVDENSPKQFSNDSLISSNTEETNVNTLALNSIVSITSTTNNNNNKSPLNSLNTLKPSDLQSNEDSIDRLSSVILKPTSNNQSIITSSTDDHLNISSSPSFGSTRKRKCSITRKRLVPEPELLHEIIDNLQNNNNTLCLTVNHLSELNHNNTYDNIPIESLNNSIHISDDTKHLSPSTQQISSIDRTLSIQSSSSSSSSSLLCTHLYESNLIWNDGDVDDETCLMNIQPILSSHITLHKVLTESKHYALKFNQPVIMSFNHINNNLKSINDCDHQLSTSTISSNYSFTNQPKIDDDNNNNHNIESSNIFIDDSSINSLNKDQSIESSHEKEVVVDVDNDGDADDDDHNIISPTSIENISHTNNDIDVDDVNNTNCIMNNNVQDENISFITTNHDNNSLLDTSVDLHNNLTTTTITEQKVNDSSIGASYDFSKTVISIPDNNNNSNNNKEYKPFTKFAVETLVSDDYSTINSICTTYNSSPEKDSSLSPNNNNNKHNELSTELNNDMNMIDNSIVNNQQCDESICQVNSLLNSSPSSLSMKDEINQFVVENETTTTEMISPISLVTNSKSISNDNDSPPISIGTPVLDEKLDSVEHISTDIIPECFQSIKTSYNVADLQTPIIQNCQLKTKVDTDLSKSRQPTTTTTITTTAHNSSSILASKKFKESSRDYGGHYENRHHSYGHHNSYQSRNSSKFDHYRSSSSKQHPCFSSHHSHHNSRYDRKHHTHQPHYHHQQQQSHRHDEYNPRYRDSSSSHRSRDRDDSSPYSSRHNHGERSVSNSSHRHQDRIYTSGNNRDPSEASNC
ncbi:unnamed protein product [Schistosoma margrebowiei]|uniref:Uncharacterized protein n=1 Tax=Schistosoma margrebowiei TaxID=48269 RepID=A0A183L8U6_9TREM|nr:unnamed protein product [Schistosoma margrebowiei]